MNTIGELLERNAKFYPNDEALVCEGRRLTWSQLVDRSHRLASGLAALGLRHQDRVGILAMNCPEYMELFSAADLAGFVVSTVNFRMAGPEMEWLLNDSTPRVLVFESQYSALVDGLRSKLRTVDQYVCIGADVPSWAKSFEDVVGSGSPQGAPFRSQPNDLGPLVYTSGTTGRPKGACRPQRRWVATAIGCAYNSDLMSGTRMLLTTPAFHVGVIGYWVAVVGRAGTLILQRVFDPVNVLETIQSERITFTFMVPAMLQALVDVPGVDQYNLSSMRSITTAAAPVPVPLLKRAIQLMGPIFGVQYGSTETQGTVLFPHEVRPDGSEKDIRRIASVGHAGPTTQLRVVDENDQDCPVGVAGEVITKTEESCIGYWNNTAATIESIRDGWFHTGDVGYLDEDGFLFLVDRKKDMIISGGENIYSREVENAVLEHVSVLDCAVIGVADAKWGEAVKAFVVCKPGQTVAEVELIAHCKTLIASYKCPKHVEVLTELPRVPSGKINKVALRDRQKG